MITRIWTDPEIIGRIYLQICRLQFQNFTSENEKNEIFKYLFALMHKLHAIKYHLENYQRIEKKEHKVALKKFRKNPNSTVEAFDLIFEFEGFLFQVKSSLDMLVKLLDPILGKGFVRTKTFAKKGKSIIKGLEQLKNKKQIIAERVDNFIELIKSDKDNWLEKVIDYRDELNHSQGLSNFKFMPKKLKNGQIVPAEPIFKGIQVVPFLQAVYRANIEFSQDFFCYALFLRMPEFILLGKDSEENSRNYFNNSPGSQFARYSWFPKKNNHREDKLQHSQQGRL